MGIRVASNRYSYRVDSILFQSWAGRLHFAPHLIAIGIAILFLSAESSPALLYYFMIFFSSMSILSIFPFLSWLLNALSPRNVLETSFRRVDADYLDAVEGAVRGERQDAYDKSTNEDLTDIFQSISYLTVSENDPIDVFTDIAKSRISSHDISTVMVLLETFHDNLETVIETRYRRFRTSHSDSQLVTWYLYSPFEDVFRVSISEGNEQVSERIISLLGSSIQSWPENSTQEIPEVFFRVFGSLTVEYVADADRDQATLIAREQKKVAEIVASDISQPTTDVSGAMRMTFESSCLNYATTAIENEHYKAADIVNTGLRRIVEAKLRRPSVDPDRTLLMMGLIGEAFAQERAKRKSIVEIGNEVTVMDYAEWTITHLLTFKDKLEEYNNDYAYKTYLDSVMREVDRVNEALETKDKEMADRIDFDEDLVVEVIQASRLLRGSFHIDDLVSELENSVSPGDAKVICRKMEGEGLLTSEDGTSYTKLYEQF